MKWEYRIEPYIGNMTVDDFNRLGKEGWELVTINEVAYFKRLIDEEYGIYTYYKAEPGEIRRLDK